MLEYTKMEKFPFEDVNNARVDITKRHKSHFWLWGNSLYFCFNYSSQTAAICFPSKSSSSTPHERVANQLKNCRAFGPTCTTDCSRKKIRFFNSMHRSNHLSVHLSSVIIESILTVAKTRQRTNQLNQNPRIERG